MNEALSFMQAHGIPPSLDEWNAARLNAGLTPGTWRDYMAAVDAAGDVYYHDTLLYFKAIDADEDEREVTR